MEDLRKRLLASIFTLTIVGSMQTKDVLTAIAHGLPIPSRRKLVLDLEQIVRQKLAAHPVRGIDYIHMAFMEYTEPSIADAAKNCLEQGADTIFASPPFTAPSSHAEEGLPNILGVKHNRHVREELTKENIEMVHANVPTVMGPTFYYSYVLERTTLQRVKATSKDEEDGVVIFLAHGDPERIGFWNMMLEHVQKYIKGNSRITYTDAQQIEMEHGFTNELLPMLKCVS